MTAGNKIEFHRTGRLAINWHWCKPVQEPNGLEPDSNSKVGNGRAAAVTRREKVK